MTEQVLDLAVRSRSLTKSERGLLIDLLLAELDDTPPDDIARAWDREIERRIAAHDAGQVETYSLEEVMAEARLLAP